MMCGPARPSARVCRCRSRGWRAGNYTITPYDTWQGTFLAANTVSCAEGQPCTIALPDFKADMAFKIEANKPWKGSIDRGRSHRGCLCLGDEQVLKLYQEWMPLRRSSGSSRPPGWPGKPACPSRLRKKMLQLDGRLGIVFERIVGKSMLKILEAARGNSFP